MENAEATSQAHTAGPWRYESGTKTIRAVPSNHWLASMDSWDGAVNHDANARLIAAAPELLKKCRQYSSDCETRMIVLREEMFEGGLLPEDFDARDIEDQIGHWQATKDGVEAVIALATTA